MDQKTLQLLKKGVVPGIIGIASAAGGFVAGYFLGKRTQKEEDQEIVDELAQLTLDFTPKESNEEARRYHPSTNHVLVDSADDEYEEDDIYPDDSYIPPEQRWPEGVDPEDPDGSVARQKALEANRPNPTVRKFVVEAGNGVQNIFHVTSPSWNYEAELAERERNPGKPYILHYDEFFNCELDYTQCTLTYYETDDILTDDHDVPVFDPANVIGNAHKNFGHGSNDLNVVYVRNDRLEAEYEILKNSSSYQEEILGERFEKKAQDELKHSHYKFRLE